MNKFIIYIAAIIFLVPFGNLFCQSKPGKITHVKEAKFVKQQLRHPAKIKHPKPKGESEIIRTKPKRKINFPNPPQRHEREKAPSINSHHNVLIADNPARVEIYYDKAIIIDDYSGFVKFNEWEGDILIDEKKENYYPIIKYLNGKEFTDKDFPLCIKKVEFDYMGTQWIDSDDLPESMIDKQSGDYSIYKIKFDAYVFDLSYHFPFATLITYPDYSTDIVIYNYDSQNLQANSVYSFEEEMPLKKTGYAWLTLGYYDLEYDQFYSAALSPYITKQKVHIPFPH